MKMAYLCAGVLILSIGGCASESSRERTTYSSPILGTRAAPRPVTPAPEPRPTPAPPPKQPQITWSERDWIPAGGIRRGLWNVIVVHHSANTVDTPESMDNYHRNVKHWNKGLGYHFVIGNGVNTPDGQITVGPRWKSQCEGAHCRSKSGTFFGVWRPDNYFNEHGVGICLIGNFENGRPTRKQLASLERLIAFLCSNTGISPSRVYGHGEVTHKTACPGVNLQRQIAQVRASVARSLSLDWPPDPAERLLSGLNDGFAAGAEADDDGFLFVGHRPVKVFEIADHRLPDPLDDVPDLDLGAFRLTPR
jgi:hypothetical protein